MLVLDLTHTTLNPFHVIGHFLYPLKTSENLDFQGCMKWANHKCLSRCGTWNTLLGIARQLFKAVLDIKTLLGSLHHDHDLTKEPRENVHLLSRVMN